MKLNNLKVSRRLLIESNEGRRVETYDRVGPVLQAGAVGSAIVAAIQDLNSDVSVLDRGAYLRVMVPRCCIVTRDAIERRLGRAFRFPGELETVMAAFKGSLKLSQDEAVWKFVETDTHAGSEGGGS